MQIVLAGASGLIGRALAASLQAGGHQVKRLVRHPVSEPGLDSWDPAKGLLDPEFLRDADAVICLSGVGVGDHRWTDAYKREIVRSRVDSVGTVARTIAEYGGPGLLIAASAVGFYGDTGDREVDERAPAGDTFLSEVCLQWEAAADPARTAGVRVAHLRTGLVISGTGGFLGRLVPLVKAGVGGRLGDGQQFMPWISLTDHVRATTFLLDQEISGPVNVVGPAPVRNAELVRALGQFLHRPTLFAVPGFAAKIALGEFAQDVLTGQRALPRVLLEAGFEFEHASLDAALRAELE